MHTDEQKHLWQKIERKRLSFEGWAVRRFLSALRESTVALIRDVREDPALALSRLDEDVTDAPLVSAIRDVYVRVGTDFAQQTYSAFAKADLRDYWLEKMLAMANLRAETVIVGMDTTTRERLRSLISRMVSEGEGQEKIIQALRNDYALNRVRARRIARTEIVSVSNYGSLEGAKSAGIPLRKEWISTLDDRTRDGVNSDFDHLAMNGTIIEMNENFVVGGPDEIMEHPADWQFGASAGNVINCFTGDTDVSFDSCKKAIRSRYSGEIISIKTSRGHNLRGTPNHPVLTDRGWVRLDQVNHSTNLVCCDLNKNITGYFDVDNIPTKFEEVYNSSLIGNSVVRVSAINVNLYSRSVDSYVNVVSIDSLLRYGFKAKFFKLLNKFCFKVSNFAKGVFFAFGVEPHDSIPMRIRQSFNSLMSFFNLPFLLLLSHVLPFNKLRFGLASHFNAFFSKEGINASSADRVFFRESVNAHTREVEVDNFVRVNNASQSTFRQVPFSESFSDDGFGDSNFRSNLRMGLSRFTHLDNPVFIDSKFFHDIDVFTLETDEGIYNSGGIIASNCRCALGYVPI